MEEIGQLALVGDGQVNRFLRCVRGAIHLRRHDEVAQWVAAAKEAARYVKEREVEALAQRETAPLDDIEGCTGPVFPLSDTVPVAGSALSLGALPA